MSSPSVRVVAFTKPVLPEAEVDTLGEFVAYVARVSNPANQANNETAPRLLRYLKREKHWSPFGMAHVVMEIETTRDIARQMLRHRSFEFQEFSQRYAEVEPEFVKREARLQDTTNRQNSTPTDDAVLHAHWESLQTLSAEMALRAYQFAIANGIAKEVARTVLPEGMTPTRMYMAGSLRSWVHYCELRMGYGTQLEHREVATLCWDRLLEIVPEFSNPQVNPEGTT